MGGILPIYVYYGFLLLSALIVIVNAGGLYLPTVLMLSACALSLVFNNVPEEFMAWERLLSFVVLVIALGPFVINSYAIRFRERVLKGFIFAIVISVLVSFFLYWFKIPQTFHGIGWYKGFFNQSMVMGPIAGISAIITLCSFFEKSSRRERGFFFLLFLMSVFVCLKASSRTAMFCFCFVALVLFVIVFRGNLLSLFMAFCLITIASATLYFSSFGDEILEGVLYKQAINESTGGFLSSRSALWIDRVNEFLNNPVWGSGFASIDLDVVSMKKDNLESGLLEPGSSWLFVLSSVGFVGTVSTIYLIVKILINNVVFVLKNPVQIINKRLKCLLIFLFLSIHMFAEGYIFASGFILCALFWLVLGVLNDLTLRKKTT